MSTQSIHIWGFFDAEGHPRQPDGAAPSDLSVYHHHKQVEANIVGHGGTVANLRTTRTLDGWLVGTEFLAPAHGNTAAIWHRIILPQREWTAPRPAPTEARQSAGGGEHE